MPSFDVINVFHGVVYIHAHHERNYKMKDEKRSALSVRIEKVDIKRLFLSLLCMLFTYLLSRAKLIMDTYPLGIAFFCSIQTNPLFSSLGYIVGSASLENDSVAYTLCALLTVFLRFVMQIRLTGKRAFIKLDDTLNVRLLSGSIGSLSLSVYRIIAHGFLYYDLLGSIFYVCSVLLLIWIYSGFSDEEDGNKLKYETSILAMAFSLILSLRSTSVFAFSLSATAAFFFIFMQARQKGAFKGALVGALCAAAFDFELCPAFAVMGALCGALIPYPAYVGVCISGVVGIFCGAITGGTNVLINYLPEVGLSATGYLILDFFKVFKPTGKSIQTHQSSTSSTLNLALECEKKNTDIYALCQALSEISTVLERLAQVEKRPSVDDICDILSQTFTKNCKHCEMRASCFSNGLDDYKFFRSMAQSVYSKGVFCDAEIPKRISECCAKKDIIIAQANLKLSELCERDLKNGRIEVMSADYANAASLISGYMRRGDNDFKENEYDSEVLSKLLNRLGYKHTSSAVYGTRKKCVITVSQPYDNSIINDAKFPSELESVLSCRFTEPQLSIEDKANVMYLYRTEEYEMKYHSRSKAGKGELVNGDSCDWFTNCDGFGYVVICDGMGSGGTACLSSQTSLQFLKRLLGVGCEKAGVLKCLNGVIRAKSNECFTSVDILEVDLFDGQASFLKCGACPSLIIRNGKIYRLDSKTPPVGIMTELYSEKLHFNLCDGDIVIMMSDGVCDWLDEPVWLYELLNENRNEKSETLCEKIISRADELYPDDKTVCIIEILRK